jgi:hypothetical protein
MFKGFPRASCFSGKAAQIGLGFTLQQHTAAVLIRLNHSKEVEAHAKAALLDSQNALQKAREVKDSESEEIAF